MHHEALKGEGLKLYNSSQRLTLEALKYICENHGKQRIFFQFDIIIMS